MYNWKVAQEV